jgi:membrane protease YdiL (CAAX protease family)
MKTIKYNPLLTLVSIIFITYTVLKILNTSILIKIDPILLKITSYLLAIIVFIYFNNKYNKDGLIKLENSNIQNIKKVVLPSVLFLAYFLLNTKFFNLLKVDTKTILITFATTLLPVFFEEILFRYFSINFLKCRGFSIKKAGLYSSILFALLHFINISHTNFISVINQSFLAFFLGLLLFSVVRNTNFFYFGLIFHFLINFSNSINGLQESSGNLVPLSILSAIFSFIAINVVFSPFTILAIWSFKKIPNDI